MLTKTAEKLNDTILDLETNLEISNQWKSERWQEEDNQDENEIHLDNNNELTTAERDNLLKNNSKDETVTNHTKDEYIKCDLFDRRSIYENDDDDFGDINNTSNNTNSNEESSKIIQNGIGVTVRENGDEQIVQVEIIASRQSIYNNDDNDDDEIDDEIDIDDQLNSFDDDADGNEFNENSELLATSHNGSVSDDKKMVIAIEDENINSVKGVTEDCGEIIVINVKNEKIMHKDSYERNDDDDDDSGGVYTNQDDEDKLLCGDGNNNKNIIGWYYL